MLKRRAIVPHLFQQLAKRSAQRLRELEEGQARLALALEASDQAWWEASLLDESLLMSPQGFRILGYGPVEIEPRMSAWAALIPEDERAGVMEVLRANLQAEPGGFQNLEFRLQAKAGELRYLSANGKVVGRDAQGHPIRLVGTFRDITEMRAIQDRLLQAQKMEALGTLAGGVAHDFNNILGAINLTIDLVSAQLEEGSTPWKELQALNRAAARAADLVKQILAFARHNPQANSPTVVAAVVQDMLKLVRASFPSTIEIHCVTRTNARVMADPTHLHQILMNLCANARLAMPDHGRLDIALDEQVLDADFARRHSGIKPGPYVVLSVSDTGVGMTRAVLSRIFEPFFTTRPRGQGTGLGLSVIHGIVGQYGGHISVYSEPGQGTNFRIFLPLCPAPTTPATELVKPQPLPGGSERILFVDDEDSLVSLVSKLLTRIGYAVEATTDSLQALEWLRQNPERCDLLITDVTMPRLTGDALARSALELRPGLPIILCSGFSDRVDAEKARSLGAKGFISKPFVLSSLAQLIRQALEHSSSIG